MLTNALKDPPRAASQWADVLVAFGQRGGPIPEICARIWIVGFASESAKYFDVFEYELPAPGTGDHATDWVQRLNRWRRDLKRLPLPDGRSKRDSRVAASLRPLETDIPTKAREEVLAVAPEGQGLVQRHRPLINSIATSLSPGHTSLAVGRQCELVQALLSAWGSTPASETTSRISRLKTPVRAARRVPAGRVPNAS